MAPAPDSKALTLIAHVHLGEVYLRSAFKKKKKKKKKSDMWLSMVTILGICALQLTHPHTAVNTHTWSTIYAAAPGEQLGIRCLAQGHHGRGIEGGESTVHSLPPPPTINAGPRLELATFRFSSPTL